MVAFAAISVCLVFNLRAKDKHNDEELVYIMLCIFCFDNMLCTSLMNDNCAISFMLCTLFCHTVCIFSSAVFHPLERRGNHSATSNNMKLVYWLLMGGLLHLVQRGGDWTGPQPAQAPSHCTKCNSLPISSQCTNDHIAV